MAYKNREDKKAYNKQYRENNIEKLKEYNKQWSKDNREKLREYKKQYYQENKEYRREYQKQWRKDNPEHHEQYYNQNKEKIKEHRNQYCVSKRKTNLSFNLNHRISNAIYYSLKGNKAGRHWETLVGYTLDDLIKRLRKTMPKGYTWDDYLQGKLEVDHIYPIAMFNFTSTIDYDFQRCWALKNLQLLPAKENRLKGCRLIKPLPFIWKFFRSLM